MASNLKTKLASGEFVLTAEVTPPLSADPADLMERAGPLKGLADAVNVTDGASARAHIDSIVAATLLKREGIEPILQITVRDRNRIALQSELVGAGALGIQAILFLTGDDPKKGDQPDAKVVADYSSAELVQVAAMIRDKHEIPSGRKVKGEIDYLIAVADAPVDPKPDWTPKSLQAKVAAGADFAQTQFCMDTGVVRRYTARLAEHGIKLPLLIGVAPLASGRSGRWMKENLFGTVIPDWIIERVEAASDPKAEGTAIAIDIVRELAEIPGVAGAHIMAPLNESAMPEVIKAFRS